MFVIHYVDFDLSIVLFHELQYSEYETNKNPFSKIVSDLMDGISMVRFQRFLRNW